MAPQCPRNMELSWYVERGEGVHVGVGQPKTTGHMEGHGKHVTQPNTGDRSWRHRRPISREKLGDGEARS